MKTEARSTQKPLREEQRFPLLTAARQMQSAAFVWSTILTNERRNDQASFQRMLDARAAVLSIAPANALDALVVAGTVQRIADFVVRLATDDKSFDAASASLVADCAGEAFVAMDSLQDYLERTSGCTLQSLGLFQDELTLQ